jgi:hypothetical protein
VSLGIPKDLGVINVGDTAELRPTLEIDGLPVAPANIDAVTFSVRTPDGVVQPPIEGAIETDGSGFLRWTSTSQSGMYLVRAQFALGSGERRSVYLNFQVEDPFDPTPLTPDQVIADRVWLKLEDAFDSESGGPWLRDMTLRYFDKRKIPEFISDALTEINLAPPMTQATIIDFTMAPNIEVTETTSISQVTDTDQSVLVQGVLLAVIRHLMRSYVEQPAPQGAQVVYEDRRDYLQRWQLIYEMEKERYERWLALWKRQFLNLGHSALLTSSKAGRLMQPGMRTRNSMRGWWY